MPDGRFDMQCNRFSDSELWYPPLPPFGWYAAEQCVPADVHHSIARTVAAIQDPTVDASQACDVTDLQVYADFVEALALQARDACVAHLTCNGAPAGCDIEPMTLGPQACHIVTAEDLCDQVVLAPALAALTDLTNGPSAAQPQRDGTAIEYVDDPQDCAPLTQDTDSTPSCDDPGGGGGDGLDESSGSSGGGAGPGPFGDIDSLVTCTSSTECNAHAELFTNVQDHFHVFYDEGVWLEHVRLPGTGAGVQLSGLDRGEVSTRLLEALGLADGDILTHVDGASLASMTTIEQLLLDLPTASAWHLTVRRRGTGSTWTTLDRSITRVP